MADDRLRCNFYCDAPTLIQLRRLAADRHITVSQALRACLAEYFALRAELALAVTEPGQLGDQHSGILHQVMSSSEARMAASFTVHEHHLAQLHQEVQTLRAMLDRAVLLYLLHTTEVLPDRQQSAHTSGKRRHEQWQKAVIRLLQTGALPPFVSEEDTDDAHPQRRKAAAADGETPPRVKSSSV